MSCVCTLQEKLLVQNPNKNELTSWIVNLGTMGYKISTASFKGPFLSDADIANLHTRGELFNVFCTHTRVIEAGLV